MKKILLTAALLAIGAAAASAAPRSSPYAMLNATGQGASAPEATDNNSCWWLNGAADNFGAMQSQTLGGFTSRVADDYILESGRWHLINQFKVQMLVQTQIVTPTVALEIYTDNNGKPGTLAATLNDPTKITGNNLGPSVAFPGFNLVEFTFTVDPSTFATGLFDGCTRIWISPYGIGGGTYFWATANTSNDPAVRRIQGLQGQFLAPAYGYNAWTDVGSTVNFTACSDFAFKVCGDVCYTIKDQGDFDLAGLSSIQFPNININGARAADNFQISNVEGAVNLCRVEGYLATNCDPTRVFGEIYANECEAPGAIIQVLTNPKVIPTGQSYNGVPVYLFQFDNPGVTLQGGRNYWFSMAAVSGGSINDRAYFLFKRLLNLPTDIYLTEGVYRNGFAIPPVLTFKPVSTINAPAISPKRDFAFRVFGSVIGSNPSAPPAGGAQPTLAGDLNGDGVVDFFDLSIMLANYGMRLN